MFFRNKVKLKFNLQVIRTLVINKGKETVKPTFIFSFSLSILAKSLKEINEISKYFKKNKKQLQKKSYIQVSSSSKSNTSYITMDTLKIKETFLYFQNKKIDQVQKIINGNNSKLKSHFNMTTKGPF